MPLNSHKIPYFKIVKQKEFNFIVQNKNLEGYFRLCTKEEMKLVDTKITAKEYLLIVFYSIEEIKRKNDYLCKIIDKQAPSSITAIKLEKVGKGSSTIKTAESICNKIVEVQNEIIELKGRVTEALEFIEKIRKPQYKTILKLRYIYGKQWSEISNIMRFNDKYIFYLHREALRAFEKIWKK